jgi:hypothetical protein
MVENPIIGPKFRPFLSLVDCLALWNEFEVNNAIDTEKNAEHCLHL